MARKILFPLCFVLALALTACTPAGQTAAQDDGTTQYGYINQQGEWVYSWTE